MLKNIIDLLNTSDWYVGDEDIDIAKGKYQAPSSWKELKTSIKRNNYKVKQDGRKYCNIYRQGQY